MQPSIKKLSELEKEQILQESYEPSCVIADLAKHHGIPSSVKCNQLLTHYCNQLLTHLRPIKS